MEKKFNLNERMIHFVTPNQKIIYIQYGKGSKKMKDFVDFLLFELKFSIGQYIDKKFIKNNKELEFYNENKKVDLELSQQEIDEQFLQIQTIIIKESKQNSDIQQDDQQIQFVQEIKQKNEKIVQYLTNQKNDKEQLFEIYVKTLNGKTIKIKCGIQDSVEILKEKIFIKKRIPVDQQKLTFDREPLEEHQLLSYYKIQNESTIHLVLKLRAAIFTEVFSKDGNYQEIQNCFYNLQ